MRLLAPSFVDRSPLDHKLRRTLRKRVPIYGPFTYGKHNEAIDECLLALAANYRVLITVGYDVKSFSQSCAVLDTGACRNFVIINLIPESKRKYIGKADNPSNLDASGNQLTVLRYIRPWIRLG